jgi:hypothetical protein
MTLIANNFGHATQNIPGVTLPTDPIEAERVLVAPVQAARQSLGAAIPHTEVMREMKSRIGQAAQGDAHS